MQLQTVNAVFLGWRLAIFLRLWLIELGSAPAEYSLNPK
jgi:hypothetical protein